MGTLQLSAYPRSAGTPRPDRAMQAAAIFLDWLNARARADKVDLVLFLSVGESLLAQAVDAAALSGFPRHGHLQASRATLMLAATDYRNFEERIDLLMAGFEGMGLSDVLRRLHVPPPADHVLKDLGFGEKVALTATQVQPLRRFFMAYRWEILKSATRARRALFLQLRQFQPKPGMRTAVVDSGFEADLPAALEDVLAGMFDLDLCCYRLHGQRMARDTEKMPVQAMLGPDAKGALAANRALIQWLFAPCGGEVVGYEERGDTMVPVVLRPDIPPAGMEALRAGMEAQFREMEPPADGKSLPEPSAAFMDVLKRI